MANVQAARRVSPSARSLIAKLSRSAKSGIITVEQAASTMGVPRRTAALKLASLARRGWLAHARRGMYLVLPLEVQPGQRTIAEDAWVLAREAFSPCYIGGWSAAEHWGLTEQIFRTTLVVTGASARKRSVSLLGHDFLLFRVVKSRTSGPGIVLVWRGSERVPVSTTERTIVDCLRDPELCGGIRNVADLMRAYAAMTEPRFDLVVAEAEQAGSGAAWKRLGYLAEIQWPNARQVSEAARRHLTTGNARLDPTIKRRGKLATRWRLWVNVPLAVESAT